MRYFVSLVVILTPLLSVAEWSCSSGHAIPNERKLIFYECSQGKILITSIHSQSGEELFIELHPNISFNIVHADYPEGNTIWSVHSPDDKTAVVYIENKNLERNAWVIDMISKKVMLFIDKSEGKHFKIEFDANNRFRIIHAGMGYRTDYLYVREGDDWINSSHEKIGLEQSL